MVKFPFQMNRKELVEFARQGSAERDLAFPFLYGTQDKEEIKKLLSAKPLTKEEAITLSKKFMKTFRATKEQKAAMKKIGIKQLRSTDG